MSVQCCFSSTHSYLMAICTHLYCRVDNSSFSQSVKPRPRLPTRKRPSSQSLFDPPNIVSVAAQAIIHFLSVHAGVRLARDWEAGSEVAASAARTAQKSLIRPTEAEHPTKASMLLNILNAKRESGGHQDVASKKKKFTPNFETNVVFVLSLFQGILTTLLFHKGKPFYLSILESDRLCQFAGISVLFALACILETWPGMNAFLELRPYARKDQKISVLSIALLDALGCILVEVLCRYFFDPVLEVQQTALLFGYHPMDPKKSAGSNALTAAEEEEMTLSQQEKANVRFVLKFAAIGAVMLLFSLLAE